MQTNTERLRELIALTGLTQRELAPRYEMHHSHLANILAGRRTLSRAAAERIAAHHRVDVRGLFTDDIGDDETVIAQATT